MKNFLFSIVFAAAIFVFGSQNAAAQAETRLNSSPKAFQTFFAKFMTAVRAGDKASVASMTRFPFEYGFDTGNEGRMTKAQFMKRFNEIFGRSPKRFLTEKNPLFTRGDRGSYVIMTDDAANLTFVKSGASFKFTAFIVEP